MRHLEAFMNASWEERGIVLFLLAVGLGVIGLIFHFAASRYLYGELITHKGVVTDMDYTPPRTHHHRSGKTSYTTTTPAKHEVYVKLEDGTELDWNHERLYQTVRLDDDVKVIRQSVYHYYFWQRPREATYKYHQTVSVTSPKGREVILNDEEDVSQVAVEKDGGY